MTTPSMTPLRALAMMLALLLSALAPPLAQARVPAPAELERLVAPVALYPDALLAQVLIAATRPAELAQAAHWSAANPGLEGEHAVRAVAPYGWDPAVQSLVAFPPLLARLAAQPDWLHALGDAFAEHEPHVMDAVQSLRRRAHAAGSLVDDDRLRVRTVQGQIVLQPLDPYTVYVPWYDPWIVYGLWPWQAHPPVVWARWHGVHATRHGVSFWWGPGIRFSVNRFADPFDWRHRRLHAVHRHGPSPRHAIQAPRHTTPEVVRHAAPRGDRYAAGRGDRHAAPAEVRHAARGAPLIDRTQAPLRAVAPTPVATAVQAPIAAPIAVPPAPDRAAQRERGATARPEHSPSRPEAAPAARRERIEARGVLHKASRPEAAPTQRRDRVAARGAPQRASQPEAAPAQRRERVEARGVARSEARGEVRTEQSRARVGTAPTARSETRLR